MLIRRNTRLKIVTHALTRLKRLGLIAFDLQLLHNSMFNVQTYMLNAVISLTTDKDVAVWKGLILVVCLFIAMTLWCPMFAVPLTLLQVAGLYRKSFRYCKPRPSLKYLSNEFDLRWCYIGSFCEKRPWEKIRTTLDISCDEARVNEILYINCESSILKCEPGSLHTNP